MGKGACAVPTFESCARDGGHARALPTLRALRGVFSLQNFQGNGARLSQQRSPQAAVVWKNVDLVRLIGVDGMRDKNAGAEKSHQDCG